MKLHIFSIITALSVSLHAYGEQSRYVTVSVSATSGNSATNTITVEEYETGELINYNNSTGDGPNIRLLKDGASYPASGASFTSSGVGTTVRGPATFTMTLNATYPQSSAYMTVKLTPVSFSPNQTLIVPPGTNQVQVSLESSTNLVNWTVATNGVYGSPDSAKFFRMRMTNLAP